MPCIFRIARIARIAKSDLAAVLVCLLASLTGTNAAVAESPVYAHFVVYPHPGNWVPDIRMSFGGSGVQVQSKLVDEPQRARYVAVPISPFVPEAWTRDGFVLDFDTQNSGLLNVRLFSANFTHEGVDGSNARPAQFYYIRPSEAVGGSKLVPEIEVHCDRIAQHLSDRHLLEMYFKCRGLYEQARKLLNRADTQVLRAFKGWFDASYNLWKESNGKYMFDERLFAEYEDYIGPVLPSNSVVFSDAGFRSALRDVHATEVGLIYNEAAELTKWNFDDEAIALLCEARKRYLQLKLQPNEPPRISLDAHIEKRIADYGGSVNDCAAMVSLEFR